MANPFELTKEEAREIALAGMTADAYAPDIYRASLRIVAKRCRDIADCNDLSSEPIKAAWREVCGVHRANTPEETLRALADLLEAS